MNSSLANQTSAGAAPTPEGHTPEIHTQQNQTQENQDSPLAESVERKLCELGNLVSGQFPMTRRDLIRGGQPVGSYFCVHGPRSVKLTAIHDTRQNQIIFYGSDGVRRTAHAVDGLLGSG